MNNSKHKQLKIKHEDLRKDFENRKHDTVLQITDNDMLNRRGVFFGEYSNKLLSDVDLSITRTINDAYSRHVVINIITLTAPGEILLSGYKYNENTGIISPHTENIKIEESGYFQSATKFIGQVSIDGINGIVCNIDVYIANYVNFDRTDFSITSGELSFVPDGSTYNLQINLFKIHTDGHQSIVFIKSFTNEDAYKFGDRYVLGLWKRSGEVQFKGSKNEGFYIVLSRKDNTTAGTSGIRTLSFIININKKAVK